MAKIMLSSFSPLCPPFFALLDSTILKYYFLTTKIRLIKLDKPPCREDISAWSTHASQNWPKGQHPFYGPMEPILSTLKCLTKTKLFKTTSSQKVRLSSLPKKLTYPTKKPIKCNNTPLTSVSPISITTCYSKSPLPSCLQSLKKLL